MLPHNQATIVNLDKAGLGTMSEALRSRRATSNNALTQHKFTQ